MYKIDSEGSNNGQFVEEDLSKDIAGTKMSAEWFNHMQQELTNMAQLFGHALDKNNPAQLANNLYQAQVPIGGIIMWSGTLAKLAADYANWQLCDGTNDNPKSTLETTPNLQDRFIVSTGRQYSAKQTGGANSNQVSGNTSTNGNHNHGMNTAGNHAHTIHIHGHHLSVAQMPSHNHGGIPRAYFFAPYGGSARVAWEGVAYDLYTHHTGGGGWHNHGAHSDGNGNHTHGIHNNGNHSHSFNQSLDNRPAYYALAFIIRLY